MGFRFRRGLRLGPFRLNFTANGLSSVSLGGRGATVNAAKRNKAKRASQLPSSSLIWCGIPMG